MDAAVRLRVKYWLLGAAIAFPLGMLNFLANYGMPVMPVVGSVGNITAVSVFAYAAVRYRLMDFDVLVVKVAATLVVSIAFVLPVAGVVIWVQRLPFGVTGALVLGSLLLAVGVCLSMFSRLRSYLEIGVESSFFPARHAAREAIRRFSDDLVKLPQRGDLGKQLTATVLGSLGVNGVALYLQGARPGLFKLACAQGSVDAPEVLDGQVPTAQLPGQDGRAVPGESREPPGAAGAAVTSQRARWEACIPIRADGTALGFIALASKRSGAAIDDSDITLLTMVAAQLAIALKNAEYVHEIERQRVEIEELQKRLEAENVALRAEVRSTTQFKEIIGSSVALQRTLNIVEKVAKTDLSILITGETGTGKELIARAIHELSPRRDGPLISVNCPAIPVGLAESELFGHERGAFTGAVEARPGKFELAHGGTIFLDEVADLPPDVQVKLLRVLQERETQRIGGRKVHKLDLRVVAATNRDLRSEMRAQRFREDLYYRVAAMEVEAPALRERLGDIPMLASFFLDRAAQVHQKSIKGIAPDAVEALCRYNWPGNIRELQNVIERAVLLCASDIIRREHLSDLKTTDARPQSLGASIREQKERRVHEALVQTGGNQAAAARLLGMSRSNLARLLKTFGGKPPSSVQ